jgi:hypothetical protein
MNICRLCNKEFGNAGALQQHVLSRRCVKDRLRNIQRIKSKERQGRGSTDEIEHLRKQRISNTMKKNPNAGGIRIGSGRGKKTWYNSPIAGEIYLRSTYELEYAKWLDYNKIKWKQNLIKFPYHWEGIIRFYYPDFFLIDENVYVEIKGYETERDKAKWREFPYDLLVLYGRDLLKMGLDIKL